MPYEAALSVKRLEWLDIGKGAAMLLVLVGHVLSPVAASTRPLHDAIYNFHMGWFLFLAGCSASISYRRSKELKKGRYHFLWRKMLTLFVPYAAWCFFSPYLFAHRWPEFSFTNYLRTVFIANYEVWFIPCLLFLQIWFFAVKRTQEALSVQRPWQNAGIWVLGILFLFGLHRLFGLLSPLGIYAITSAYTHVFPFVAGVLMFDSRRAYRIIADNKTVFAVCLAVFVLGVGFSTNHLSFLRWLPMNYYSQFVGIAASVAFTYASMRARFPSPLASQLSLIGKYTLVMYLAQGLWLPFWLRFEGWNSSLLIFLACLAISVPVAYICIGFAKIMEMNPVTRRIVLGQFPSSGPAAATHAPTLPPERP